MAKDFLSSGAILLYLLIASVLIANGLTYYATHKVRTKTSESERPQAQKGKFPIPSIDFPTPDWLQPLTPVILKRYANETVELDGKWFQDCEFQDVTFLYNGTKDTRMDNCRKSGKLNFSSRNPLVSRTAQLVDNLRPAAGKFEPFDGSAR
jgi:hypothetical protein